MSTLYRLSGLSLSAFIALSICTVSAAAQSGRVQATPTPTPQDDTLRISTEEIKLNVLAFDESGNFFRDVTERDLVISENDVLHVPASVRRLPANVLIVMDTGGEMRVVKSLDRTRQVARAVVNSLRPGDSVAIMTYADKVEIVGEWTSERSEMLAAIKRTNFGRRSVFVDALNAAADFMMRDPLENKHIVLITDGTDSLGRSSAKFDALQRLLSTDISVHVISYTAMELADIIPRTKGVSNSPPPKAMPDEVAQTLPNGARDVMTTPKSKSVSLDKSFLLKMKTRKTELEIGQAELEKIAETTNGEFILPGTVDEMVDKAALVSRMIDSTYVVTYVPKIPVVATRGIAERKIEVTSKRPGLTVQARRRLVIDTHLGKK